MQEIAISKFKATCLAVLEQVRRTGQPVRITRRGEVVAEIQPVAIPAEGERKLGWMEGALGDYDPAEIVRFSAWDRDYTTEEWDELEAQVSAKEKSKGRRVRQAKR